MSERSPLSWFLGGGIAGAAALYLLEPSHGRRRRAELAGRARSSVHAIEDLLGKAQRDASNRVHGLAARATGSPPTRPGRRALSHGTPERRLLEGSGGLLLSLWGLGHRGIVGAGAALAGLTLIARAATSHGADRMIRVQKTLTVAAPLEEVYAFWSRFENFPRFMEHVLEVRDTEQEHSHWRVTGPAGIPIEWEAEVTARIPDRSIAWRSVPGSVVDHHGEVHFERVDIGLTRVSVHMAYLPPGGALAHAVASFLHGDPRSLMDDDLLRMKSLLETGKATARSVEVHRDELA